MMDNQNKTEQSLSVMLPFEVLSFLAHSNHSKQKSRFSKMEAFNDLIRRYKSALHNADEVGADLTQLSKTWNWSQLAVKAYIERLLDFGMIKVEKIVTRKVVSLNSDIFLFEKEKNKPSSKL